MKSLSTFSEYITAPADFIHKLPEGVSVSEGALTEPSAIVCHTLIEKGSIRCNDRVAIVGPGAIGIISAQVARAAEAHEVVVFGVKKDREVRLKLCQDLGFLTYEVDNTDTFAELRCQFDFVVEASGHPKGIQLAIELTGREKKIVVIGIPMQELILVPWAKADFKALNVFFSYSSGYTAWEIALSLMKSKKIKLKSLITHDLPLEEWEKAFIALEKGEGVKAILRP